MHQRIHNCAFKEIGIKQYQRKGHHNGGLFFIFVRMSYPKGLMMIATLWLVAMLTGCENDIERINLLTDDQEIPVVKGTNITVIYSDSAKVKVQILAPAYLKMLHVERPYDEFPEGLEVFFFNDSMEIESEIRADYTIYYPEERLWHATGNVVAQRLDNGDALNTEELFWDEEKELIYSDTYTKIQNEDGIFYGKRGFESHQNLTNWQLKGTSGTVNVQNEE
jgi:LPS export ABC transporter protein LptC